MKNRLLYITQMVLLLLFEVTASAVAQSLDGKNTPLKVQIFGNVYGGGELAQVIEPNADSIKNHIIQDADLATLFNKKHTYTTYVHLGEKSEVYGQVFGGGKGQYDTAGESAGRVTGQTDVALDGATVWSEIFGGGQMADVRGNTLVHFKKGKAGHNAFGGGLGVLGKRDAGNNLVPLEQGDKLADNRYEPLASADIKLIPADYDLIINDNAANLATLKNYYRDGKPITDQNYWIKKTGESFVVFDGTENSYTHYEFMEARTVNRDSNGKPVKVDGKYYTETEQFDPSKPEQLFSINHNIYGGGMTASKVDGKTFVHINYGMVNDEMMNFEHNGQKVWTKVYKSIANAQFCVFGGGYGYHTDIYGDANVTMDVQGDGKYKYINAFTDWFADEGKRKYGWDTNVGDPELIYKAADEATWSHGAPGRSCMDIVGGGYNGKVHGTTNVTVDGDVVVRKVYGGGYYASVGNTNVNLKSGIFERVYGGGMIGNVYGTATLNFGQQGGTEVQPANTHLLVKDAIYGGNDVSGTVGTSRPTQVTHAGTGVKYNVYTPYDSGSEGYYGMGQTDYGVRLNIYGGLVLGDVYGAGNGNHPGYGNPDYMEFNLSQHPSENYRQLAHQGTKGTALVYKYRPRTARVVMNIQGNSGEDFNDVPTVDKVRIWGRTFGGGNSCNVGVWDGTQDDNAEVYAEDATSWHPGDNFKGGGTIEMNIGSHVQLGNRDDSHEKPNGLFMGSNGEHMVTQHLDKEKAKYYHQYWDSKAGCYYPGFVVYDEDGNTPIKRSVGLKAFTAFINNIHTKSDNVTLNIKNLDGSTEAQDVWMSNFVGGGYRGSMQAATENGRFAYTLPKGVTVGHAVVGGAFNAHIIYRVYATNYGAGTYRTDADGNYLYETIEPEGDVKVISKAEAEAAGETEYDYIKKLYAEGHEGDEDYKTGYLRYNFDGGMMGHESGPIAVANGARCGQVKAGGKLDFTQTKDGDNSKTFDMSKALVYLDLRNRMEPIVETTKVDGQDKKTVHGGIVYGGCFATGYVDGDSWVDYRCSLSPLCTDVDFFDKSKPELYEKVDNFKDYNALNVYGAGYGADSHVMGDAYLRILHNGTSGNTYDYPLIYNAFGGGNNGTVAGNTNVYYNVGRQGSVLGSLYAGGYKGEIGGNTKLELAGGLILNGYGGSREANIGGASHVWAYDGEMRPDGEDETSPELAPLLIGNLYGGNDISGTINGRKDATWTESRWNATATSDKQWEGKTFSSYVQIGGTEGSTRGYPMVGNVFAGGNGVNTPQDVSAPDVATALLEVDGGTVLRAFGGGNKATVTDDACIFVQATDNHFARFTFSDYQKIVINNTVLNNINSGYEWIGNELRLDTFHIVKLYGGNNLAPMAIQPTWNLAQGSLENVYSGGNLGDMTHPEGIHIDVTSVNINIRNLFGGCRMADVRPTALAGQESAFDAYWANTDHYGATVNCIGGYIGNVYGGNDISGTVAHGTKVVVDGAVENDVYCAGNGNYLYKWDSSVDIVTELKDDDDDDVIYKVPAMAKFGGADANDTQKLLTINAWRPSVDRSLLEISGDATDPSDVKVAFVKGNVYCGGNASTVTGNAATKLTIGSHVNVRGLFMGSDGADFSKQEYIAKFEKLNGFDMTAATDFGGLTYGNGPDQVPATSMTAAEEIFYPNLLALYMKAVEMESLPTLHIANDVQHAYIGTWCGGGNRGSMSTQSTVNLTIPENITIYDKIVAGCMDANVKYVGKSTIEDTGGYYRPLNDGSTEKLCYTINAKFLPRYMSVPAGMDAGQANPEGDDFLTARGKYFLYENVDNTKREYRIGNNIYGGCYESGDVLGDVVLNVNSDLLEEPLVKKTDNLRLHLDNTSRNDVAAFNVYGAGMGMNSNVWGNVTINMNGNANNVYGGGRSGTLIGNASVNMLNGIVYRHIIGGSDAGYLYGNTQIAVGYPTSYKTRLTGSYRLNRADEWNTGISNHDGSKPVVQELKLVAGDIISEAVYNMLAEGKNCDTYFDAITPAPAGNDWSNTDIYIGGGIYGGGYALATGSTVYAGDKTVRRFTDAYSPKDPNTGAIRNGLVGYGGNANIMVADDPANATTGTEDHITISTLVPVQKTGMSSKLGFFTRSAESTVTNALGDPIYTWTTQADGEPVNRTTYYSLEGQGGIYGDGHLSFVEGFRSADIQRYGYAEYTPQHPKLMNTMQRLDVASVKDCCIMLQGARDFATNATDATIYSIARVRELQMHSSIDASTLDTGRASGDNENVDRIHNQKRSRNYIGFFNNVHYIGAIKSDVDFASARYNEEGEKQSDTYQQYKAGIIAANYNVEGTDAYNAFRTRNLGTAKNMIGINNGYTLKIQNVQTTSGDNGSVIDNMYYGPVVGVFEAKLLSLVPGEGGGYIYADNVHGDSHNFLNTSGNFVFPSTVTTGSDKQYIVDDCFPAKFSGEATADAHYWFVEGNKYWYNASITGYTADNANMTFNMDNADQIVTLFGTEKESKVRVKSITWEHAHSGEYDCDINNPEKDYVFSLSVSADGQYNQEGGYLHPMSRSNVTTACPLSYDGENDNGQGNPLLGVRLVDNVQNNGEGYYDAHLKEPCSAKIVLESENNGNTYTYTVNLAVIYLKGPSVTGMVMIDNCALPGELIRATVKDLIIETNDGMPVTRAYWRVVDPDDGSHSIEIPRENTTEIDNSKADFKALYKYNGWQLQYVVESQNNQFPVDVSSTEVYNPTVDGKFKTLLVHNYHKMSEVQTRQSSPALTLDPQSGAWVYINSTEDLRAFAQWINEEQTTEGVHFYLQRDLSLPADWSITKPFLGTLHGDGYVLDATAVTGAKTLFGSHLMGQVYNLGLANGAIASTGTLTNCFDNTDDADALQYGRKAYQLSHYFKAADGAEGYVQRYYAGEDWRYARTTADNSGGHVYLRTAAPAYGTVNTSHNPEHTVSPYTPVAADFFFFGQHLDRENGDAHPVHFSTVATGDPLQSNKGGNRVYETAGYCLCSQNTGFYYNKDAWALQPTLTAIDFTSMTAEADGVETLPATFGVKSGVSQNLLVYNAGESLFGAGVYADNTPESAIRYHSIANGGITNLHLVDKQDFNAPRAFTVSGRAWYERRPDSYRNVHTLGYESGSAWEGLCLPFAPTRVSASTNGEITHFWGSEETGHEYWLRELKSVADAKAIFERPQTQPIAAGAPYIVAFPGNDFYEFSMEGSSEYNTTLHGRTGEGQTATFEATAVAIPVSDDMSLASADKDGYIHQGTFICTDGYGIVEGGGGSSFEADETILPFRTFLTATSARARAIWIADGGVGEEGDDEPERPEEELGARSLKVYIDGRDLVIESTYDTELPLYTASGHRLRHLRVVVGENRYGGLRQGFYLVGTTKVVMP